MVWDRSKHPSLPTGTVNPQLELLGHAKEGFGLSWSPHSAGHLATGSEDKTVRLWFVSPPYRATLRSLSLEGPEHD
jgi:histone-binding protein RBBP4